jgi:antitoxin (DNA-binding transcriptional repressor) of toxin-antitoxin stability system
MAAMDTVDIRELKTHLNRHLKRVRAGAWLLVTDRGRSIATISPVHAPTSLNWAHKLVASGHAQWSGGKPVGAKRPPKVTANAASAAVLENRR